MIIPTASNLKSDRPLASGGPASVRRVRGICIKLSLGPIMRGLPREVASADSLGAARGSPVVGVVSGDAIKVPGIVL